MAEISRGQVNYNTVAGSVGLAGAAMPVLQSLFGGGNQPACPDSMPINRYEMGLINENTKLQTEKMLLESSINTDRKQLEMYKYIDGELREIRAEQSEQKVYNATNTAAIGCLGTQIGGIQAVLNSIIKTAVNKDAICPSVMPMYNSWTAPTTTTTTTPTT